jgi:hypothetical protein
MLKALVAASRLAWALFTLTVAKATTCFLAETIFFLPSTSYKALNNSLSAATCYF